MAEIHLDPSARWVIHPTGAVIVTHPAGEALADHQARAVSDAAGAADRPVTPTGITTPGVEPSQHLVTWRAGEALWVIDLWYSLLLDHYPFVWGQGHGQPRSGEAAFRLSPPWSVPPPRDRSRSWSCPCALPPAQRPTLWTSRPPSWARGNDGRRWGRLPHRSPTELGRAVVAGRSAHRGPGSRGRRRRSAPTRPGAPTSCGTVGLATSASPSWPARTPRSTLLAVAAGGAVPRAEAAPPRRLAALG